MSSTKHYWKDLADLHQVPEVMKAREQEFAEPLSIDQAFADPSLTGAATGRRDFLKFLGFSIGAATLAACETPVIKSIPYVNKPEDITPGVANWYASTYYDGHSFASILVKTREGRPIHIMGNPSHGINRDPQLKAGTVNARINSSVLGLYDSERLKGPVKREGGNIVDADWDAADTAISAGLAAAASAGKRIVLLTHTIISPTTRAAVAALKEKYPTVEHVQYDTVSYSGLTNANLKCFGKRVMPSYDLTKADVVVGMECDFLGGWGNSTEHAWQYARRRRPTDSGMNRHLQFETRMSITGANADDRVAIKPSELPLAVLALHDAVARKAGAATLGGGIDHPAIGQAADALWASKGRSVVLCGSNDEGVQTVVNHINTLLGNYGSTIDLHGHTWFYQGDDAAVDRLVKDMSAGSVGALLVAGVNPAYSLPNAAEFAGGLEKVALSVSFSSHADETASRCTWICPDHHYLESWNDHMPKPGHYATVQPAIRHLFNTRQWQEGLLRWTGAYTSYHAFLKGNWRNELASRGVEASMLASTWDKAVHDGVMVAPSPAGEQPVFAGDVQAAAAMAKKAAQGAGEWELLLYTSEAIGDGSHASNPWLQELPDPITKVTWDNYVMMSPVDVERLELSSYLGQESPASVVKVSANGTELELPVVPAPGQKVGTISIALGYGRGANGERVGKAACLPDGKGGSVPVGRNAYPLMGAGMSLSVPAVSVQPTGGTYPLALTQTHLTGMDRHSVVRETNFATWSKHDPKNTYNHPHELAVHADVNGDGVVDARDKVSVREFDLWEDHAVENVGHRWGLSIDLNACTGCGACVTACNSENNIPVVGKDEVRRSRDMHWLRIDRYFSSDMNKERAKQEGLGKIDMYLKMEVPSENPRVVFMPVMCQHCNHAPCETVCPVAATTHSNEGLNQMAYNRCIGTRYCANNCPYKVRRFNWFNYISPQFGDVNPAWDDLGRMVLNPDVTVRSRGVIEKCSMCVQRIQAGKLEAKKAGAPVPDGSIQTACSAACGTGAIVFGDLNDKNSLVRRESDDERAYHMLEEVGVRPNVSYLAKVRNTEEAGAHHA